MKYYRPLSIALAIVFGVVGIVLALMPEGVIGFFNSISYWFSLPQSPAGGHSFFVALAAAYMYLVTALAFMMYRYPGNRQFPLLLANAKSASSVLSLMFFLFQARYLIYAVNFLVDGAIAGVVFLLYRMMKEESRWVSC